jgi:RNA polymerase sigma-70 factor (ECF subfamily)
MPRSDSSASFDLVIESTFLPLDSDDIEDLFARHARQLLAFFTRRRFDAEAAVELMAETFADAFASRKRCRANTSEEAVAWLYGIGHARLTDWLRRAIVKRKALSQLGIDTPTMTDEQLERIDEVAGTERLRAEVAGRLLTVAPDHQTALRLRVVEELLRRDRRAARDQRAHRAATCEHTAQRRVSRALRALSDAMTEPDDDA